MIDDKVPSRSVVLLEELHNRTREGKIGWLDAGYANADGTPLPLRGESAPLGFRTNAGGFTLRIQMLPDDNFPNEPNFALHIVNPDTDEIIETISNTTLGPALDYKTADGLTPYVLLKQIYERARRQARGVEDVLDRVLESLRQT
jgi:hypothetical protein